MGCAWALCSPVRTNMCDQIYMHIDLHKWCELRLVFLTNYLGTLKYVLCICYTLEKSVRIWYTFLLGSLFQENIIILLWRVRWESISVYIRGLKGKKFINKNNWTNKDWDEN